jgi:peptidylprolyl isomerase
MSSRPIRKTKPSSVRARSRNKKIAVLAIIAAVVIVVLAFVLFSQGNSANKVSPSASPSPTSSPQAGPVKVLLHTSMGDITIQLRADKPVTSGNFKNLVQKGTYNGTIFHRVISGFMIQGGDPTGTGYGDPSIPTIPDEIGTNNSNVRGTIAMANAGPNSASSQFFINTVDNGNNPIDAAGTKFDTAYTVFGEVISGMNVVDAISNVATTGHYGSPPDKPLQNVTIISATILP